MAIGRTLAGVQSFNYRRGMRHSLPGQTMVLHPDEPHDGPAGTGEGFRYRMLYVDPALLQAMLGDRALPFVEGGVTTDQRVSRAHDFLRANCERIVTLDELEQVTGRDRFSLPRNFRRFYGTGPYRYLTMRSLDLARRLMLAGTSLADAARGLRRSKPHDAAFYPHIRYAAGALANHRERRFACLTLTPRSSAQTFKTSVAARRYARLRHSNGAFP